MRTDKEIKTFEIYHEMGERAALVSMMREITRRLGYEHTKLDAMIIQREEAIAALRSLCNERDGADNEWPNDLHLADIITKHLGL
jgi:hypothetical protein